MKGTPVTTSTPTLSDEERQLLAAFSSEARKAEGLAMQIARHAAGRGLESPSLPALVAEFEVLDEAAAQARRNWLAYRSALALKRLVDATVPGGSSDKTLLDVVA